jgi:hypothetical protein
VRPDDLVGLREPRPWRAPPPNPDVPFQVAVPAQHGMAAVQEHVTDEDA